jgi:hypothetical protein
MFADSGVYIPVSFCVFNISAYIYVGVQQKIRIAGPSSDDEISADAAPVNFLLLMELQGNPKVARG